MFCTASGFAGRACMYVQRGRLYAYRESFMCIYIEKVVCIDREGLYVYIERDLISGFAGTCSISRQHTSAYGSICQHTSAYVYVLHRLRRRGVRPLYSVPLLIEKLLTIFFCEKKTGTCSTDHCLPSSWSRSCLRCMYADVCCRMLMTADVC